MRAILAPLMLALALGAGAAPARAEEGHDRARAARQAGEIRPLGDILAAVARDYVGDVIEVELERDDGRWVYEVKLLTARGSVLRLDYDARTAELRRTRGRGADAARRR